MVRLPLPIFPSPFPTDIYPPQKKASPPPGVRRGLRHRYKPLDWWRQERVVYGRRESGVSYVPHIKEIIRVRFLCLICSSPHYFLSLFILLDFLYWFFAAYFGSTFGRF
jgi:hypothetical protein